jgi:putative DNA primase/helicase
MAEQYHLTEAGNAQRFAETHGQSYRYVQERGWIAWDDAAGVWVRDRDECLVTRAYLQMLQDLRAEAELRIAEGGEVGDLKKREQSLTAGKAIRGWAVKCESERHISAALRLARKLPGMALRENDLDAHPELLCVKNGTIELSKHPPVFRASRKEDYLTIRLPVPYDAEAVCNRWMRFLKDIWPGDEGEYMINYIHQVMGYCLTGRTDYHAFHVLWGSGANGKSVFLSVLRGLMGEYAKQAPVSAFIEQRWGDPNGFAMATLKGARLVTLAEAGGAGGSLSTETIKQVTGGDTIRCRHLRKDFFEFTPRFKIFMACNSKPKVRDDSQGVWRRLRLLPFTQTFKGDRCDPDLTDKLLAELPGVLQWALNGIFSLKNFGWEVPDAVWAATEEYREQESPVIQFLADIYDDSKEWQPFSWVRQSFREWCDIRNIRPWSDRALSEALQGHGIKAVRRGKDRTRGFLIGCPLLTVGALDLD